MKQSNYKLIALFLLSVTTIAFEIAVMRTFAVGSWSNFGSMVISIALLGNGLAGTLITFLQKHIKNAPNKWLSLTSLLLLPTMTLAHVLAQYVPFNPVMIVSDSSQYLWIGVYYLLYAIPFFIGALFIGIVFIVLSSQIHKLYFWNMAGSGIGGFVILGCMYILPPDYLVVPLLFIAFLTVIFCNIKYSTINKHLTIDPKILLISLLVFSVSFITILLMGKIKVSEYKPVSITRRIKDVQLDHYSFSPTGEMHVYSSSSFHFAPGLSDVAALNLQKMPEDAFKGLFIDGGGPIGIQRRLKPQEERYMYYLPISAPYQLLNNPDVLLIRLGGGMSIFTAKYYHANTIQVLEPDPAIENLIRNVKVITDYNSNLLADKNINVKAGEPRAFCAVTDKKFDLVEISLIDSVGLSQTGGYSLDENYTYTVEAIGDYMRCLRGNGMLSITVWNKLIPARNVPKLLSTVVAALKAQRVAAPGDHIFMFNVLLSTATVLVKKDPFTQEEIAALRNFCRQMDFNVSYYPGIPDRQVDFEKMLYVYQQQFVNKTTKAEKHSADLMVKAEEGAMTPGSETTMKLSQDDFYFHTLQWLIGGREKELYRKYVFDITPAYDNQPYYTAYLKPQSIGMFLDQLGEISAEWGYLLLLGTFLQSILFGLLIVLVPIATRWQELFKGTRGTLGVIVYYACLGLAYMLVEIFLIQRLVFFLGDPIFSTSLVITSMLIISGIGSLFSQRFKDKRVTGVRIAAIGIGLSLLFYMFGLSPCFKLFLGASMFIKGLLTVLFIAPAAFFMGIPFPSGLASLTVNKNRLLPWAWGMNGALSVTGSVIVKLISISYGFLWVLGIAIVLYVIAALVFKANEAN